MDKPTIPEVADRFTEYLRLHAAWGSLHIVLDDHNIEDDSVRFCIRFANEQGDTEGAELAGILLRMSQTQRGKLGRVCRQRLSGNGTKGCPCWNPPITVDPACPIHVRASGNGTDGNG